MKEKLPLEVFSFSLSSLSATVIPVRGMARPALAGSGRPAVSGSASPSRPPSTPATPKTIRATDWLVLAMIGAKPVTRKPRKVREAEALPLTAVGTSSNT